MGGFGAIALSRKCDLTLCKSVGVELSTNAHGGTFVTWDSALDFPLANSTTAHGTNISLQLKTIASPLFSSLVVPEDRLGSRNDTQLRSINFAKYDKHNLRIDRSIIH
jgi:hypothetical protein